MEILGSLARGLSPQELVALNDVGQAGVGQPGNDGTPIDVSRARALAASGTSSAQPRSVLVAQASTPAAVTTTPVTPARPTWISPEEDAWFNKTGGLQPVALYNKSTGTVDIKLKKPGLTPDQIFERAIGATYNYYTRTDLVEASFRGDMDGKHYLYTGTTAKTDIPLVGRTEVGFVPVVTSYTSRTLPDGSILIEWQKADRATAEKFLRSHQAELAQSMKQKVTRAKTPEAYIEEILAKYDDTKTIRGKHHYYPTTGYYLYEQQAVMTGAVANFVTNAAGVSDIKGAALKIGYIVLREDNRAGGHGTEGTSVSDMSGAKVRPGK